MPACSPAPGSPSGPALAYGLLLQADEIVPLWTVGAAGGRGRFAISGGPAIGRRRPIDDYHDGKREESRTGSSVIRRRF